MAPSTRSRSGARQPAPAAVIDLTSSSSHPPQPAPPKARKTTKQSPHAVPIYTIDLSLRPSERYVDIARDFASQIRCVTPLFDEIISTLRPRPPVRPVKALARLFLRRLHSAEETEELRGISRTAGVDMYLLVAFNTFLDALMGCTSGGVRVRSEGGDGEEESRMLHFRTLDWGMDQLRSLVVLLQFVREKGGPVVARSVTYAGYVGCLTGVRQNLSLSLNFRPNHNPTPNVPLSTLRLSAHNLLVILGLRRSISSLLRTHLLSTTPPASLASLSSTLPSLPTTAAYLIFSDGVSTLVLDKDHRTAVVREERGFIVATNHDSATGTDGAGCASSAHGMQEIILESTDRMDCIAGKWRRAVARAGKEVADGGGGVGEEEEEVSVAQKEVVRWVRMWPITNECTHYAAVMDPRRGEVVWVERYLKPVSQGRRRDRGD
ncbi:MAG: hypothetical protein M1833_001616 [Piccolia ochrophora]|nr:MAG: hypothetical protein M1833_001616 [Piccolia ochrophora]